MTGRPSPSLQFQRSVHRGLRTLAREGRLGSSVFTIAALLLLLELLLLGFLGINAGGSVLRSHSTLKLEIQRTASTDDVQGLYAALTGLKGVSGVQLITKEQAYLDVRKRDPSVVAFIDAFGLKNPFPDTIIATLDSVPAYGDLLRLLQDPRWQGVVAPEFLAQATSQEQQLTEVLSVTETSSQATAVILGTSAVALLLALVSLLHRRILQRFGDTQTQILLGASPGDVFVPLWTETTILLLSGLLVCAAVSTGLALALPSLLPSAGQSSFIQTVVASLQPMLLEIGPYLLGGAVLILPLIGALAAALGLTSQQSFSFLNRSHA